MSTDVGQEPTKKKPSKKTRPWYKAPLKPTEWAEIQARYEKGDKVGDIAKDYGIALETISRKATRGKWKRASLHKEAISEAREEVKKEIKDAYREDALKTNEDHRRWFQYYKKVAAKMMLQLEQNLNAIEQERVDKTEELIRKTGFKKPVTVGVGNLTYQIKTCGDAITQAIDGERRVLKLDELDPSKSDEDDKSALGRLKEILEAPSDSELRDIVSLSKEAVALEEPQYAEET